jgi:hypothetical protein
MGFLWQVPGRFWQVSLTLSGVCLGIARERSILTYKETNTSEEASMNLADLNKVAVAMVKPGKGLLAADESSGTIKKRFDDINVVSTEETRYLRGDPL